MNANEKLDAILTFLNIEPVPVGDIKQDAVLLSVEVERWKTAKEISVALFNSIDANDTILVLHYLKEERQVESREINNRIEYRISFIGRLFIENGGFVGEKNRELLAESHPVLPSVRPRRPCSSKCSTPSPLGS